MNALLTVDNLTVHADPGTRIIDGVSLTIHEGEVLALVGESGSGKSMTALALVRLLPAPLVARADALTVAGEDLLAAGERRMNAIRGGTIGMLFQQPKRMLDPTATVGAHVAEPLRRFGRLSRAAARRATVELLADVGIPEPRRRARAYAHQLSGGIAQRVMIATALAGQPRLLIADEPTTALDATVEAQILRLIAAKKAELGMSVLFISHDLRVVSAIADRIAVMYAGRIVEQGPAAELLAAPQHPYTRALVECSLLRPDEHGELYAIPGHAGPALALAAGCRFRPRCAASRAAHLEYQCAAAEPELAFSGRGSADHATRCWVASPQAAPSRATEPKEEAE
ncbi:ABC transporter ATP-binding protein [Streptomyces sp. PT12]|uniref:ABC transporter ATP-binding protein n=1 Tax=Streptomyces sp. PT12 TaxID=1510197 RepID=UPI000DE31632|nr:ABC transporter ATP-binding protein [Streptomyces sp. PT12]RBM12672.1 dipeptide ABC transporter ATP-binding protein DppD [Streptomyces sp. PT12]